MIKLTSVKDKVWNYIENSAWYSTANSTGKDSNGNSSWDHIRYSVWSRTLGKVISEIFKSINCPENPTQNLL